ncbi:DUF4148 domain-containing protein [Mycetohabitans sp. B46]|uniref:DUF4148 domain-containing protein n=1 Tax=Mycetohabitans sp. B46 TaxID=2772536 RepID=UPI00307F5B9B
MNALIKAVVITTVAAAAAVPLTSFAQTNAPLTHAQVRAELIELEQVGYNPATANDYDYPNNIQAAEARVAAKHAAEQRVAAQAVGGVASGSTQAGSSTVAHASQSVYMGH